MKLNKKIKNIKINLTIYKNNQMIINKYKNNFKKKKINTKNK